MYYHYKLKTAGGGESGPVYTDTIAFDAASGSFPSSSTTWTQSHTCTGTNRVLIVNILSSSSTDAVTNVTYAGISMTKAVGVSGTFLTGYVSQYYLIAPATGANNIVVTFSAARVGGLSGLSYTGCNQTTQCDVTATANSNNSLTFSIPTTTTTDNNWIVGATIDDSGASTAGANTFRRTSFSAGSGQQVWDSNAAITPAGATSLNFANTFSVTKWIGTNVNLIPLTA